MKNIYKYLVLGALIVTFYACKKELSALPKNAKVDANTILDQGTAQIALNGVYYCFANATAIRTGWGAHQYIPGQFSGHIMYGYGNIAYESENRNADVGSHYWEESYKLINAANGVLKGVNALADNKFVANRKAEILSETRFLRAYGHFKLLIWYGEWYKINSPYGILFRDELSALGNISKPRSSVKDSYDFILADLDYAIANGPAINPNVYATKWAAMALKMRVLISRGATADYTDVISLANNIIASNVYTLEPNARDLFRTKGLSSKEVILGIKSQVGQELNNSAKSLAYTPRASSLYAASPLLKALFTEYQDPRGSWIVSDFENARSVTQSFYLTKYIATTKNPTTGAVANDAPTAVSETDYAFRLSEVYLLKGEALARLGGDLTEAKKAVHLVQEKAGITATTNNGAYLAIENATSGTIVMEIYKETVKTLVAEDGMEWMALLRLPFEMVKQLKPTITSQILYILPVPRSVFMYNPTFGDQNPGYLKN